MCVFRFYKSWQSVKKIESSYKNFLWIKKSSFLRTNDLRTNDLRTNDLRTNDLRTTDTSCDTTHSFQSFKVHFCVKLACLIPFSPFLFSFPSVSSFSFLKKVSSLFLFFHFHSILFTSFFFSSDKKWHRKEEEDENQWLEYRVRFLSFSCIYPFIHLDARMEIHQFLFPFFLHR